MTYMLPNSKFYRPRSHRRRGFVTVYLAFSLIAMIGIASLVVDLGIAYQKRARMQKAADASALAGAAYAVQNPTASGSAIAQAAADFATNNYGYTNAVNNVVVTTTTSVVSQGNGLLSVGISRPQPTLFARIFRVRVFNNSDPTLTIDSTNISARAGATFTTVGRVAGGIAGNSDSYGLNSIATANLSLMGPLATTNRGDNRSSYYKSSNGGNNGTLSVNTNYARLDMTTRRPEDDRFTDTASQLRPGEVIPKGDGYYFDLAIPANTPVAVQLYDPGNANENKDPSTLYKKSWNETNTSTNNTSAPSGAMRAVTTKTRFQVWCDMAQPNDITKAKRVFSQLYADESQYSFDNPANAANKGWINSVNIDPSLYPVGSKFYMNATTVDGTGKNGFNVRLNRLDPSTGLPKDTDTEFSAPGGNGTNVTTRGLLPINFGSNGTADLTMGYVPPGATSVTIKRFDVDVGTSNNGFAVNYKTTPLDGNGKPDPTKTLTSTGALGLGGSRANDQVLTDTINLTTLYPGGYPGGVWNLTYAAGQSDQSTWEMTYEGPPQIPVTNIRLVD